MGFPLCTCYAKRLHILSILRAPKDPFEEMDEWMNGGMEEGMEGVRKEGREGRRGEKKE